jgi:predicted ATPase
VAVRIEPVGNSVLTEVARQRGFSRFVGRAEEMTILEAALARSLEGHGQVVGIVGEPGVGKSRLCHEFVQRCRDRGVSVYEARGVSHGKAIPFLPTFKLLRNFFAITERDADQGAMEKIAERSTVTLPSARL